MAAALLGMSTTAMAQATYLEANGDTTVFKKHVFMQLQGGAQYTLGEAKFGDLISPNVQFGLSYPFNLGLALALLSMHGRARVASTARLATEQTVTSFTSTST